MYVCSQNTAKTVHDSTKISGPPYSTFACGVQYQVSFKSGNERNYFKKSIPNLVKYSSGVFDQYKQPQRYSSLELSFFFSWNDFFSSTTVTTVTQRVHGSSSILLKLSSCLYVCMFPKYCQNSTRWRKNFWATLLTIRLRCAVSSFIQIGQRKKLLKNQFPIQSSTL